MDERYLKRAEEQLYGELAAALDMPRDQVLPFIRQTWEKWPEQLPKQEQESAPAQEAAAYLKRNGADLTKVRKMSRESMETYRIRAKAISEAEILYGRFAIATLVGIGVDSPTVIGAQVSNELLDIDGIEASFVLTGVHERVYISARSIDEVNVQKIMEEFGGGGHLTVAGAQLVDVSLEEAKNIIHETLRYLKSKGEI